MRRLGRIRDERGEQNLMKARFAGGQINVIKVPVEERLWVKIS
jgi:hypothetical protein